MSARLARTLLKLYPRRIRKRYGEELLELQSELEANGDLSRPRLIRDMLVGALLVRPARQRAYLAISVILVAGVAATITIIGARGTDPPQRASGPPVRLAVKNVHAVPYGTCFVASGGSCSLTPCTEFIGQSAAAEAVVASSIVGAPQRLPQPATTSRIVRNSRGLPQLAKPSCTSYFRPRRPVFVAG